VLFAAVTLLLVSCTKEVRRNPKAEPSGSSLPSISVDSSPGATASPGSSATPFTKPSVHPSPRPSPTISVFSSPTPSSTNKPCPNLPSSSQSPSDLEQKLEPARSQMHKEENMQVGLTLTNHSLQEIKYSWEAWFIHGLVKGGVLVGGDDWSDGVSRPAGWKNRTLGPLQSQTFTFYLDSFACRPTVSGAARPPLPTGAYEVVSPVMSNQDDSRGQWWYAPKVTVTIIP
jgi:hypothetical protein